MSPCLKHVRKVQDLVSVEFLKHSPWPIPHPRGSRARGMAFERAVGKELKTRFPLIPLKSGQWFRFSDSLGTSHAQPDHYLIFPQLILLLECKLKQNTTAEEQLLHLYRPILEYTYHRPVFTIQAFRHWRFRPNRFEVRCPSELLAYPREGIFMWQFLS